MPKSQLPRDKKDRSVRARMHDPYKAKGKLQEPSVCRKCNAVYHKGRWTWDPAPAKSHDLLCPACERIQDGAPSGVLLLTGELLLRTETRLSDSPAMKRPCQSRTSSGSNYQDRRPDRTTQRRSHYHDRPPSRATHRRSAPSCTSWHIHLSL